MKKLFAKIISGKKQAFVISIMAIFVSLIFGAIILLILKKNPLQVYYTFLQGTGFAFKEKYGKYKSIFTDFMSLLNYMTPLLFASLAVAVGFRAGIFNIAVSGQMLIAGFISTILVGYTKMPTFFALTLCVLISSTTGALVGAFVGFLKYRFNINEVVTSIMINYIIMYVVGFFIQKDYIDPISRQSKNILASSRITIANVNAFGLKFDFPLGMILAVIIVLVISFIFTKTLFGFEITMIGKNKVAAKYAGVHVGRRIVQAMSLSGAIAGLAGITYYMGYYTAIPFNVLSTTGFTAISVSLLGNNNPFAIIFSSLLISIITKGSTFMSSIAGVEKEIAGVITSIILVFAAMSSYFRSIANRWLDNYKFEIKGSSKEAENE